MVDILKNKLQLSTLLLSSRFLHMRCCAHILNLIMKDDLEVIKKGIENIHDSVEYWTASPKRCEKYEETTHQI